MAGEDFEDEILEDLRTQAGKGALAGATWRVIVDPAKDLPEQKALTLLILPPSLAWNGNGPEKDLVREHVLLISGKCGGRDRLFKNTLLFLAGTSRGLNNLRQARREKAALEGVKSDYWDQLDKGQRDDLQKRLEAAERATVEALGPAYTVAIRVVGEDVEVCSLADARPSFQEHLGYLWTTLVDDEEWILRRVGSVTLEKTGLIIKEGALRIKDAIDAFLRFTDKPMISSKDAVTTGLVQACADGLIGIGRGGSPSTLQASYCKQTVSIDPNEDGVWIIPAFEQEQEEGAKDTDAAPPGEEAVSPGGEGREDIGTTGVAGVPKTSAEEEARKVGRFKVSGSVPVENYGELFRCFVGPAARMNLKKLNIGIQFEMETFQEKELDPNDPSLKAMQEAARQLGIKFETEE
jgi:hypothetical protein